MSTAEPQQKKSEGPKVLLGVVAVVFALLLLNSNFRDWFFGKILGPRDGGGGGGTVISDVTDPQPATTPQTMLVGTWQSQRPDGANEVYTFDVLNPSKEGTVTLQVFQNGQLVTNESWTGMYRWWDNPLLGAADRTQIQIGFVDPAWGKKEFNLIVRSLSDNALVLEGIYNHQQFQFQRIR